MLNANPSQASYFNKSTFEVDKQYLVDKENNSGGNSYCNQMTPSQLNGNSSGNDLTPGMRSIQQDDQFFGRRSYIDSEIQLQRFS